jgi:hypothetical protein
MKLSSNVHFLLEAQIQFKIMHWQTKGYARHNAFGMIYDSLDDNIDKFVEAAMGKYGRFTLSDGNKTLKLENLTEINLINFVKTFKNNLIDISKDLKDEDTDLMNIRDEMLGDTNKLSYLLTLE